MNDLYVNVFNDTKYILTLIGRDANHDDILWNEIKEFLDLIELNSTLNYKNIEELLSNFKYLEVDKDLEDPLIDAIDVDILNKEVLGIHFPILNDEKDYIDDTFSERFKKVILNKVSKYKVENIDLLFKDIMSFDEFRSVTSIVEKTIKINKNLLFNNQYLVSYN